MKSILLLFIAALAIGLSFLACNPKAEKIKAYKGLISTSTFEDTVITYSLFSDSLILEFAQPPKMKRWYGEIFLIKSDPDDLQHIPFPNSTGGKLGYLTIEGKRLAFSGFHIPADSLDRYYLHFHATPTTPGFHSMGNLYGLMYLFCSKHNGSNKLEVNKDVKDFRITSFDLVKLKNMSPELRAFCRDSIEKAFYMTFTDVEIEESKY